MINKYNSKNATKLYNKKLKEIEKYTGDKTTYLSQLNIIGKQLLGSKFKGVFPSDKIPKLTNKVCYCILNVDKSTESGSHWVSLAKIENNESLFYDSFGREGVQLIKHLKYSGNGTIVDAERDEEQQEIEQNCGARAISFLCILDKYGAEMAKWI